VINISVIYHEFTQLTAHEFFSCVVNTHADINAFNLLSLDQALPDFYLGLSASNNSVFVPAVLRRPGAEKILRSLRLKVLCFINPDIKYMFNNHSERLIRPEASGRTSGKKIGNIGHADQHLIAARLKKRRE
jgi:hypothetical protein